MKFDHSKEVSFMKLVIKSPDMGEGWRRVAYVLEKMAETRVSKHPELYETKRDSGLMIRLSKRGLILADYL